MAANGPSVLILPKDIQDADYEEPALAHGFTRSGVGYSKPKVVPEDADLAKAADILNAGDKVAILIGAGARGAALQLTELATLLGAGVAKALLGKDVLPDDLPFVTGAIGLLGTEPSWDLMQGCDTLLMVGTGFPWSEFLPKDGGARAVQIDIEASMLSLRYPAEVNLHGDAADTLKALLPLIKRKEGRDWATKVEANIAAWWKKLEGRAKADAKPVNPQRVVWEMSPLLPANAIVTSDSGSCANWFARDYRVQQGQSASLSGGLASMGAAVPYAIGAKFAHPHRPVIALVGDGAMQMNNMAELITVQKYWKRSALDRLCLQQSGSQRGDLGAACHGRKPEVRSLPGYTGLRLRQVWRDARVQGHLRGHSRSFDLRMAGGAFRRSPGRARGQDRSGDRSASAPPDAEAGTWLHVSNGQGR
jgi:pyruvate dehydrogenase (quinone)